MKLSMSWCLAVVVCLTAGSNFQVRGQYYPGGVPGVRTPTVSPYLNLNRRGTNTALNYYNLVRPEFEFRNSYQSLQGQVNAQQKYFQEALDEQGNPATGHTARFLNLSHYFGGVRSGAGGGNNAAGIGITLTTGAYQPYRNSQNNRNFQGNRGGQGQGVGNPRR